MHEGTSKSVNRLLPEINGIKNYSIVTTSLNDEKART
jgi:hypothetical protein